MSVIAMQVIAAREHPNADALRVYQLEAPEQGQLQLVANLENQYQVGDVVVVAQIGARLLDGTRIRRCTLRGVDSMGMAMGLTDAEIGADLTEQFCRVQEPPDEESPGHWPPGFQEVKWTKIEQLHHVLRHFDEKRGTLGDRFVYPTVSYRAKVKLDGTNGGIHILQSGEVIAQSRSRLLTVDKDNLGFAAWVEAHQEYFQALSFETPHAILYGEWCGQGIQKRTSISKISQQIFAVFAIQYGDHEQQQSHLEIEPARIEALLPEHPDIFVLPWCMEPMVFPFGDRERLQEVADAVHELVLEVEQRDPWVAETFGVEGMGEGVVLYPTAQEPGPVERGQCTRLMFKAKGEKHQVVRQRKSAQLDPEVAQDVATFVEIFVTPARLEQALQEGAGGNHDPKKTGDFLKWIGQDIKREGAAELEASDLSWRQVSKAVTARALEWFKAGWLT